MSDAVAGDGFADHFSGHASAYAEHRPSYPANLYQVLSGLLSGPRQRVLDCACGNGQASVGLARHFESVEATDASARQIANAEAHPSIRYRCAPAERSGLEDKSVDMVCVAQALHWFDHPRFFAEAKRVLRPGGVLACWAYELCSVNSEIDAIVMRLYEDILGAYWPPERVHIENKYSAIGFPLPVLDVPEVSMIEEWTADNMLGYLGTWSALQRCNKATGQDALTEIASELKSAWGSGLRSVCWPLLILAWRKPG